MSTKCQHPFENAAAQAAASSHYHNSEMSQKLTHELTLLPTDHETLTMLEHPSKILYEHTSSLTRKRVKPLTNQPFQAPLNKSCTHFQVLCQQHRHPEYLLPRTATDSPSSLSLCLTPSPSPKFSKQPKFWIMIYLKLFSRKKEFLHEKGFKTFVGLTLT